MNKTSSLLLAAVLGTAAFAVQADELYTPNPVQGQTSTLTRAQVKQSVLQARKAGELDHNDVDQPQEQAVPFGKTRTQVKAETLAARKTGGLDHNDVDLPNLAKGSVLTRQEVRAEAIAARKTDSKNTTGRNTIDY